MRDIAWTAITSLIFAAVIVAAYLVRTCRACLTCGCGRRRVNGVVRDDCGKILDCIFCSIVASDSSLALELARTTGRSPSSATPASASQSPPPVAANGRFDFIDDPSVKRANGVHHTHTSHYNGVNGYTCTTERSPTPVLYSTPWVVVFAPRNPVAVRHLLVVPRQHIEDVSELVNHRSATKRVNHLHDDDTDVDEDDLSDEDDDVNDSDERRQPRDEEKELSPTQLLCHMRDVGHLILERPELLSDPSGGRRKLLQRRQRRRHCSLLQATIVRWQRRGRQPNSEDEITDDDDDSHEKQSLIKPITMNGVNGNQHREEEQKVPDPDDIGDNQVTRRKTTAHSPSPSLSHRPTVLTLPATSTNHSHHPSHSDSDIRSSKRRASHPISLHRRVSGDSPSNLNGLHNGAQMHSHADYRLCFHLPPNSSISHLHLHALQLPIDRLRYRLSFLRDTPWCWEVDEAIARARRQVRERGRSDE